MCNHGLFLDRDGVINLIGDKVSDIMAGNNAGVGENLLFASERPIKLDGFKYELITTLPEATPYLKRGVN
jgi:histidinol phosphatase-like enzyme